MDYSSCPKATVINLLNYLHKKEQLCLKPGAKVERVTVSAAASWSPVPLLIGLLAPRTRNHQAWDAVDEEQGLQSRGSSQGSEDVHCLVFVFRGREERRRRHKKGERVQVAPSLPSWKNHI